MTTITEDLIVEGAKAAYVDLSLLEKKCNEGMSVKQKVYDRLDSWNKVTDNKFTRDYEYEVKSKIVNVLDALENDAMSCCVNKADTQPRTSKIKVEDMLNTTVYMKSKRKR